MEKLDARGRSCPEPVIMVKKAIEDSPNEILEIIVDSHVSMENIKRFVTNKGYSINVKEDNEEYTIEIKK